MRFPSAARILRKIAQPLGFEESQLLTLADYLSPQPPGGAEKLTDGQLDPYVAMVLSQEPVDVQRAVVIILSVMKSMARGSGDLDLAEFIHRKYPGADEDIITMIEDILEHPPGKKRREEK
jgi:hypothetical protein